MLCNFLPLTSETTQRLTLYDQAPACNKEGVVQTSAYRPGLASVKQPHSHFALISIVYNGISTWVNLLNMTIPAKITG